MSSSQLDFSRRADLSEWMDEPCSYADFRDCLRDIKRVNRIVLGYRPTLRWLKQFAGATAVPLHIVDVGCGGGDMLRRIEAWAQANNIAVRLTGIDLNPYAARAAREFTGPASRIEWITGDAFSYQPPVEIDIVISSLFTHHLPDVEIVRFLQWMDRVASRGWFINDLDRARVPYYAFGVLGALLRGHRFVRHDGPVSIRRSFAPEDWENYCAQAALERRGLRIFAVRPARLCLARVYVDD